MAQELSTLGNSLKPVDDDNYFFFAIVRELVDAAITNFNELRRGYTTSSLTLIAWASRNLLELTIFMKYVLKSGANAKRFSDDRLIDGCELIIALKDLERHYEPTLLTPALDDALKHMKNQMVRESVTAAKHLEIANLAKEVGMEQEFRSMNRVSSKLVHPTAWSILAENPGRATYAEGKDLLFATGIVNMRQLFMDVRGHNRARGMMPPP